MGPDDDADDLPTGGPPPRAERPWRHPSELQDAAVASTTTVGRGRGGPSRPGLWIVLTASALIGTVVAVVAVGLVSQLGSSDADGDSAVLSAGSVSSTPATAGSVPDRRTVGSTLPRAATAGRAWLGIEGTDDEGGDGGVLITSVDRVGPAATAGLQTGDVIVVADREAVESMNDLHAIIAGARPGDVCVIEVLRGGVRVRLMAVLGERS